MSLGATSPPKPPPNSASSSPAIMSTASTHITVLLNEAVDALNIKLAALILMARLGAVAIAA